MNAIQFIKEKGVDKAREVVSKHAECYMPEVFKYWSEQLQDYVLAPKYAASLVSDLKRLVESVDLIGEYGGLYGAIDFISGYTEEQLAKPVYSPMLRIKQAIADYELIYSNDMGDDPYIENHVSPLCKVEVK